MNGDDLCETLELIARRPGEPAFSTASYFHALDKITVLNANMQKDIYSPPKTAEKD